MNKLTSQEIELIRQAFKFTDQHRSKLERTLESDKSKQKGHVVDPEHDKRLSENKDKKEEDEKNKDLITKQKKDNYAANRTKIRIQQKIWRDNNKDKIRENQNRKLKENIIYKLKVNIRNLIGNSIRNNNFRKLSKTEQILGCTFEEFKIHLESKFEPWMTWEYSLL